MKTRPTLRHLALSAAVLLPLSLQAQEPASEYTAAPTPPPPAPAGPQSASTSKITVTIEKDGKSTTHVFHADLGQIGALAPQLLASLSGQPAGPKVAFLGVSLAETPDATLPGADPARPDGLGLAITGVTPGSPAAAAGLQPGDILLKLDDQDLVNQAQFTTLIRRKKEGDTVSLTLRRQGIEKVVSAILAAHQETAPPFGLASVAGLPDIGKLFWAGGGRAASIDLPPEVNELKGHVIRLGEDNKVIVDEVKTLASTEPGAAPRPGLGLLEPEFQKVLRQLNQVKKEAAGGWQEQIAKLREQWAETQKQTLEDYRKTMDQMREELARAAIDARKVQEDARRAIEEVRQKLQEDSKRAPDAQPKAPEPKSAE